MDPKLAQRLDDAARRREDADYQCYLLLLRARPWVGKFPVDDDDEGLLDLLEEIEEALDERAKAGDELQRALAGHEPREDKVQTGRRLTRDDGLLLFETDDLLGLGEEPVAKPILGMHQ